MKPTRPLVFGLLACLGVGMAAPALAQQKTHPPVARFWMDAATHSMSIAGMEEMEDNPLLGGMMGSTFGMARHGAAMPGKWLDAALHTQRKPAGTEGAHAIPAAMNMRSPLPLLPVVTESRPGQDGESEYEKPQGRLLFYWGCGSTVRAGQPRILDFSKAKPEEFGKFMTGRHAPDRGAKAVPGRSIWPNKTSSLRVPKDASLVGEHALAGEGVPADWRFAVPAGFDFMERIRLNAAGNPRESILARWNGISAATGYFLSAIGSRQGADGVAEMIIWSSSESPDPGWGLMDYLAPVRVDRLVKEKVVLPRQTTQCAIPQGIYAQTEGAMLRMIAYGPELNLAHPPRPSDPKIEWKPDWSVLLRLKSTGMAMIGEEAAATPSRTEASPAQGAPAEGGAPSPTDVIKEIGDPVKVLKGIFGR